MANAASADLSKLAADLSAASGTGIQRAAEQIIQQTAQKVQAEAQTRAPVRSGRLRNSISIKYVNATTALIGPEVDYGVYQEFGTGSRGEFPGTPYTIKSRRPGGYLVFRVGNRKVFTRSVQHPGVRAKAFMRGGLEAALGPNLASRLAQVGALLITKGPNA